MLPVNAVDGDRNWGYDGVGWYAVTRATQPRKIRMPKPRVARGENP